MASKFRFDPKPFLQQEGEGWDLSDACLANLAFQKHLCLWVSHHLCWTLQVASDGSEDAALSDSNDFKNILQDDFQSYSDWEGEWSTQKVAPEWFYALSPFVFYWTICYSILNSLVISYTKIKNHIQCLKLVWFQETNQLNVSLDFEMIRQ